LKGFAWVWVERVEPKKSRVPRADVLAVRVRDLAEKAALLAGDPLRFFTEPHLQRLPRRSGAPAGGHPCPAAQALTHGAAKLRDSETRGAGKALLV
jgi:hypothetical protein